MKACFDSWAILRWLEGVEPVAGRVEDALDGDAVMSWINLGEVFSISLRAAGPDRAHEIVGDIRARVSLDEATPARVLEAASIKAVHPMAFADAFAVATSIAHGAALWTGDPEILDAGVGWNLIDLR